MTLFAQYQAYVVLNQNNMIDFIKKHLYSITGELIPKKCRQEWFINNGYKLEYETIYDSTKFLNSDAGLVERIYCLENGINESPRCGNCHLNKPAFFNRRYSNYCSTKCAQSSPDVRLKIKKSNLEKTGNEYPNGFSSSKFISTIQNKYGVDNISKNQLIKDKKRNTFKTKYGVESPIQNEQIHEKIKSTLLERYGVDNPNKSESIKEKIKQARKKATYSIIKDKFKDDITFLFTEQEYLNTTKSYQFKCNHCNSLFNSTLKNGRLPRCLVCYPYVSGSSNMEKEVVQFINSLGNFEIIENNKQIIPPLELDIYLPEYNLAIEFNGLYWHSENEGNTPKEYHLNKTERCFEQGIKLIHIFEDEWLNKKEIVKSIIRSNLKLNEIKIAGRKCRVGIVDPPTASEFYNNNHIQGSLNSTINIGLFYLDELVSLISFSKPRSIYGNLSQQYQYELTRFCSKIEYTIQGGASKLFSYFIQNYNPTSIITYSDICKTGLVHTNNIYNKLGFEFVSRTSPNYWYIINDSREYRYKYQKRNLSKLLEKYDPELTEWQNMQLNKYDRIWDCGNLKFAWNGVKK